MFLVNDLTIVDECKKKENGILEINPLCRDNLKPTFYYFRLGRFVQKWDVKKEDWLTIDLSLLGQRILSIEPLEYIRIQSLERFRCSKKVFAIFGHSSRLFREGLTIRNSPFIDPGFPDEDSDGFLELCLKNELSRPIKIKYSDIIGKISFYNVSDTYPIGDIKGQVVEEDWDRRKGPGGNIPEYDDHPAEGFQDVIKYGKNRPK